MVAAPVLHPQSEVCTSIDSGIFTIHSAEPITAYKIIDANGKKILKQNTHNVKVISVDLATFSPGLYTLEVSLKNKVLHSKIIRTER